MATLAQKNYYDLLEVLPRASKEVIDAAYRALMRRHHPDVAGGNKGIAQSLNEAYAMLSDQKKRERYDEARTNLGGKAIGEFRILEFIAEGAIGKTYKGEHILTGQPVCIKHCSEVSPQHTEIFIEESKAMWDLRHYSIPAVRTISRLDDGSIAIIMSYIPGPTLTEIIKKTGPLDAEYVAWITERLLNVLMYMHYNNVVHGDVKPDNIIIQSESHTVVLIDFGLATIKPRRESKSKGWNDYFSPPELMHRLTPLPESDFYSLGMTLLFALGGSFENVVKKEVPASTPDPLCAFIKRLIVRDVLLRPRWDKEDLFETFQKVRMQSFGKMHSGMKPIPGIK